MKTAIIGSRSLDIKIKNYLPENISLIISGGAKGIDRLAQMYADKNGMPKLIFLPDYEKYGRLAPLERNRLCCYDSGYPKACKDCSKNDCKRKRSI